jgi:DNA-directed RNA polymerase specialized sigma24 family protein
MANFDDIFSANTSSDFSASSNEVNSSSELLNLDQDPLFLKLSSRIWDVVNPFLESKLPGFAKYHAPDITQDTYLKFHKEYVSGKFNYKNIRSFDSWLKRVSFNLFISDYCRKKDLLILSEDICSFAKETNTTTFGVDEENDFLLRKNYVLKKLSPYLNRLQEEVLQSRLNYPQETDSFLAKSLGIDKSLFSLYSSKTKRLANELNIKDILFD